MFHQILMCPKFETTRKVNCFNYQLVLMRQCTVAAPILSKQTKKGLSLGLDPAHQLKKEQTNEPATPWKLTWQWNTHHLKMYLLLVLLKMRIFQYWCLACHFFQGLIPDFLGFDREQTPPPITMVFREVRQHQLPQEMIWLICEHIPIAYIHLHLPVGINHSWIGQKEQSSHGCYGFFAQLKRFTLTHLLSDFDGTEKTP